MSLQTIVDISNELTINRRKVVGVQITRNEIVRTTETPTRNPWRFIIGVPNSLRYSQARQILETLDNLDRRTPQNITFSNNPNLSWMFAYQGGLPVSSLGTINNLTVVSFTGNQLTLRYTSSFSGYAFRSGDILQLGAANPYPFTVVSDATLNTAVTNTFTVTTHRANFLPAAAVVSPITVGNRVTFRMLCDNMPTYTLTPGGLLTSSTGITNHALIGWDDSFNLIEYTGDLV